MSQDKYQPVPLIGEIMYLLALNHGMLDALTSDGIQRFKEEIFQFVKDKNPKLIEEIASTQDVTDENEKQLGEVFLEFFELIVE